MWATPFERASRTSGTKVSDQTASQLTFVAVKSRPIPAAGHGQLYGISALLKHRHPADDRDRAALNPVIR
jgi:hypothetical protein